MSLVIGVTVRAFLVPAILAGTSFHEGRIHVNSGVGPAECPVTDSAAQYIAGSVGVDQSHSGGELRGDQLAASNMETQSGRAKSAPSSPTVSTQPIVAKDTMTSAGKHAEDPVVSAGFVSIPPGSFTMGSPADEPGRDRDETLHQVTLTHGIYIQATEVTNRQYTELAQWAYDHGYVKVSGNLLLDNMDGSDQLLDTLGTGHLDISFGKGVFTCINPDHPVKYVTWYGSAAWCDWLSLQQGRPRAYDHSTWRCNGDKPYAASGYRLPTEAEWEYACRAGSRTAFASGSIAQLDCYPIDPNLDVVGWYCGNSAEFGGAVAQKLPNAWGLYDFHGNVYEWCNDWYGAMGRETMDPTGPKTGTSRVVRGGCWNRPAPECRSASRDDNDRSPDLSGGLFGFRPVRSSD